MGHVQLFLLLFLSLSGAGSGPAQEGAGARAPDLVTGGRALGRALLASWEEDTVALSPGPFVLTLDGPDRGAMEKVAQGLTQVLAKRGFSRSSPRFRSRRPALVLELRIGPEGPVREGLLRSRSPREGSWSVQIHRKEWVQARIVPQGRLRIQGDWATGEGDALAAARQVARAQVAARLLKGLPWRPWRDPLVRRALDRMNLEEDAFVARESMPAGSVWRAWVLWQDGSEAWQRMEALLAKEDKRWIMRCGGALLAALLLWGIVARLDWATRGFFTGRLKVMALLVWLGVCGILGMML